jgi:hypothetical protein
MATMTDKLTSGQRWSLAGAVLLVAAGMAIGFLSSFTTLYGAASAHGWAFPALLPLAVDSGILAYVLLDQLAVTLGARSRWLHLVAWVLAGFTVWANAAVSPADGAVWRVIHAAMPALWVLGVEALRFTWRRLHEDPAAAGDEIPRARWLAAPWPTLKLWRRMKLANVTSYERAAALEEARLHARDLLRAAREADPRAGVPAALRRAVRTGRLPAPVTSAVDSGLQFGGASRWEPEVAAWVTSHLTLPDRLAARLAGERKAITEPLPQPAPAAPPEVIAEGPAEATPEPAQRAPRKPAASAVQRVRRLGRKATDEDLLEAIRELASSGVAITKYRVATDLPVGEARAGRLVDAWKAERPALAVAR